MYKICRYIYKLTKQAGVHYKNALFDKEAKILVLTYHRVVPEAVYDPLYTAVRPDIFAGQLDRIAKRYPVISLTEAHRQCIEGRAKSNTQVVLSFDDGYRDIYENAFPVLKKKGLPAIIFIPTDCIDKNSPPWDRELVARIGYNRSINEIRAGGLNIIKRAAESRRSFVLRVLVASKYLHEPERREVIAFLKGKAPVSKYLFYEKDLCMNWDEVKCMSGYGIEIGSHGVSHSSLSHIPLADAKREISESKAVIEQKTGRLCDHFAFPFGTLNDCNPELIDYVRNAGFKTCLLNIQGYNHIGKDVFCLKRTIVEEGTSPAHLLG